MRHWKNTLFVLIFAGLGMAGCSNPETPAGYVGYVTQGAYFGKSRFYGLQEGPTSTGLGWLLSAINISITPTTETEPFLNETSVLSRDNLKVQFQAHMVWRVRKTMVREFVEKYSTLHEGAKESEVLDVAFKNFLREPFRTYSRDEVQKFNGLEIKDNIIKIGDDILARVTKLTDGTPFEVTSVVVGNIQYPSEVADAVAKKMAFTQDLERKKTEIEIEKQDKEKRIVQAEGIAKSMEIINHQLTSSYIQHEAIEAQKAMVNSPNHTTVYIPVGPMGVPLVGTFDVNDGARKDVEKNVEAEKE